MTPSREPLGAAVIALIVVDIALVLAFGIMLGRSGLLGSVGGVLDRPTATASSSPTSTAAPVVFASPTRNISCAITPDAARCEIAQFMYATPTLEGCSGDVGHEIEVTADGARWVCRAEAPPSPPGAEIADLAWGDSTSAYGYTCTSASNGVICTHTASGHSFSLARRAVSLS